MKSLFELSEEEKTSADVLLFYLSKFDDHQIIENPIQHQSININTIEAIESILISNYLVELKTIYYSEKKVEKKYKITEKGKTILSIHGGLSLYIDNTNKQNINLQLAKKAFRNNKKALLVTIIALVISSLFQITDKINIIIPNLYIGTHPSYLTSFGLLLDIVGAILIFKYGLPSQYKEASNLIVGGISTKENSQNKIIKRLSYTGIILLTVGFVFQLIGTNFQFILNLFSNYLKV